MALTRLILTKNVPGLGAEADQLAQKKRNIDYSAGKKKRKKKPDKWRLNRPHGQERSLVKREMALAEVRRHEAAKKLSPFRPQVLHRMVMSGRLVIGIQPYSQSNKPRTTSSALRAI